MLPIEVGVRSATACCPLRNHQRRKAIRQSRGHQVFVGAHAGHVGGAGLGIDADDIRQTRGVQTGRIAFGAGAEQVLIADIEVQDGTEYGEALLVVLPKDAAARAKVFEVNTRAETTFENDGVTDKGQKYLYYSLD